MVTPYSDREKGRPSKELYALIGALAKAILKKRYIGILFVIVHLIKVEAVCSSANEKIYFVATTGDNVNPGTYNRPFATIEKARDEVRRLIAKGLKNDVTVMIRGGTYYLKGGLQFGPNDSGVEEYQITYSNFESEVPVLVGGANIKSWMPYQGKIFRSEFPAGVQSPKQVFENGRRLDMAKAPQSGYFKIVAPVKGQERSAFAFNSNDIDAKSLVIDDARAVIWQGHDWFTWEKSITRIDKDASLIYLGEESGYPMTKGNRYIIKNVFEYLAGPGECQISYKSGYVYIWPRSDPAQNKYVISTAESIVAVKGTEKKPVINLHFKGLNLSIANGDAISLSCVENCSIRNCMIENAQNNGIHISGYAQKVAVYGNLIQENGMHGISLAGYPPGGGDVHHNNRLENNHIRYCGRVAGHGSGIWVQQSGENRIANNYIHDMPRIGIQISGKSWPKLSRVKGITWDNHYDFLYARKNIVSFNHIHHVNLDSQDAGAVGLWGSGRDNVIRANLIHDTGNTEMDLQSGIYVDSGSDYTMINNNIVYRVVGAGRNNAGICAKGIGTTVVNNIFIVGASNAYAINTFSTPMERSDHHSYLRNIFYFEDYRSGIFRVPEWSDDKVIACDYNIYFNPMRTPLGMPMKIVVKLPGRVLDKFPNGEFLKSLRLTSRRSMDQHSITENPGIIDIAKSDFRLRSDSPALKVGFLPPDTSRIGLKEDFPSRFNSDSSSQRIKR